MCERDIEWDPEPMVGEDVANPCEGYYEMRKEHDMPGMGYISSFLMLHSNEIRQASLTSDELTIEFHDTVAHAEILMLFADLINFCQPRKATLLGHNEMCLEF